MQQQHIEQRWQKGFYFFLLYNIALVQPERRAPYMSSQNEQQNLEKPFNVLRKIVDSILNIYLKQLFDII